MFQLKIPKPCHAEWSEMAPTQQGAFCSSCSKEVIDFTKMNDEEVKNYFLHTSTGSTCGRFRTGQLHRIRISIPESIFIQKIAGWKKFMAVVMLAFGSMLFGCDVGVATNTQGKTVIQKPSGQLTGDTTYSEINTATMGMISPEIIPGKVNAVDTSNNRAIPHTVVIPTIDMELTGTVCMIPDSGVQPVVDTATYIKMGEIAIIPDIQKKKPASDTSKCKDPGYY